MSGGEIKKGNKMGAKFYFILANQTLPRGSVFLDLFFFGLQKPKNIFAAKAVFQTPGRVFGSVFQGVWKSFFPRFDDLDVGLLTIARLQHQSHFV